MTELDPRALRQAFGAFMTGVTVVTARDTSGAPVGFTANSFTSVSMDPPLLLVCPGRFLSSYDVFRGCTNFAISILAEGQEDVSNTFAYLEGDRFAKTAWSPDANGVPWIDGAAAQFSCRTHQSIEAGDHVILLGAVLDASVSDRRGLGYAAGQYFSLGLERDSATAPEDGVRTVALAIVEHCGNVLLRETPEGHCLPVSYLSTRDRVRSAVTAMLRDGGVEVDLGPAYAVFDDRATGVHHICFLGQAVCPSAGTLATGSAGTWHPISTLSQARFPDSATAAMMRRFAEEYRTRTFGLYIGDDSAGEIAPMQERT